MNLSHLKSILCVLLGLTVFIASCQKAIKVNLPALKHQLVVNCNTEINQPLNVGVSRSASISERKNNPDLEIRDAVVKLYVDGVFSEQLVYNSLFGYRSIQTIIAGKQYNVRVSAPILGNADATVTAPLLVPITNITRIPDFRKASDGTSQDKLIITFSDPPGIADYYIIKLHSQRDSIGFYIGDFCVNSPDASIEPPSSDIGNDNTCLDNIGIYLRDELFNGKQKELVLYAGSSELAPQFNGVDSQFATIELLHVPEAYFRFSKSLKLANETNGSPFAEPVNVYSNIINALGIFSIFSRDSVIIR